MSRRRSDARPVPRSWQALLWSLLVVNLVLLAFAIRLGSREVRDGAAGVTDGWIIAGGILLTLPVVLAVRFLPLPPRVVALGMILTLFAQVAHATGHLARLYYLLWWYDDLLHFGLVAALGLVLFVAARSRAFLFDWRLGPVRVAALVWIGAVAAAAVWEIFEFLMDIVLGTREQDNLVDTMVDMLDGAAGALVASVASWRVLRLEERGKALADAHSDELLD